MARLHVHGIATGGDGVARADDGRVVFVRGALPGEVVDAEFVETRKRFARAVAVAVEEPAPGRRTPPCRHVEDDCGGCDLQHADVDTQRRLKLDIVRDCLERIGRLSAPVVEAAGSVPAEAYRTTMRVAVRGGRAGHRARRSHAVVITPDCLVAHPSLVSVVADARFGHAEEVFARVSIATGEVIVIVAPTRGDAVSPLGRVVGADEVAEGADVSLEEDIAGVRFRVSARSFLQSSPTAASLLVEEVRRIADASGPESLADLYGGIGVFAATVPVAGRAVLVERNPSAVADARINLGGLGREVDIVQSDVARWRPEPIDLVVADPARAGLGRDGAAVVAATGAADVALVSCDPGSLGRDAGLLVEAGYRLVSSRVVDVFPQTSHVEVVSHFTRSEGVNPASRS
ncbi:MAG: TRAM domain-containing protein [Actinomycetota bacterium]